jgi:hypothetical protein
MANNHFDRGDRVASKTVPLVSEKWYRQALQRYRTPPASRMTQTPACWHCGQQTPRGHRMHRINATHAASLAM